MVKMVLGAIRREVNLYSLSIPDLEERFHRIVDYLKEHSSLPKPPTLVRQTGGLEILDGNHRLSAYFYCYGYFKLDIPDDVLLATNENQRFWLAES